MTLPALRVIRIDHNIPAPKSPVPKEQYDGTGIIALKDGKLEELGIGHAFSNAGMAAAAQPWPHIAGFCGSGT